MRSLARREGEMHRDGIEVDADAGCSFLTIGKSVKASLGGGGDRRRTSTALSAACG
jgi:hypothetical protein